ncbi:MAG: trehalose synthase, partial [Actinomycetota bacterium]|nr:trehalose synthase [Actinomycetota bacterium]
CRERSGWSMLGLHNFGADRTMVRLDLGEMPEGSVLNDLLEDRPSVPLANGGTLDLELDGYGFRWLRVVRPDDRPLI